MCRVSLGLRPEGESGAFREVVIRQLEVRLVLYQTLTPDTLHPTLGILHPTPYTMHPTLSILHPTPCTLHPTLYTLHPTLCMPHPAPSNLHLGPHTPHPTPYTLHHTPYRAQRVDRKEKVVPSAR